ncbi:MAG: hypothetical protein WCS88_01410 [Patescibacteria group bacterium]|jgi:hypothetical protein
MNINDLNILPEEVQDFIWTEVADVNYAIDDKFSFNFEQFDFVNKLEDDIILKKRNILDLPKDLEKIPGEFKGDLRELALQMAMEIFWPLQEYIGGVDRLILRLGGKVPRPVFLKKKQVVEPDVLPEIFQGKVKELLKKYEEFKDFRLTPNKILDERGRITNPSVQNWIKDYVHFLGAGQHSSLERTRYIAKNKNALQLEDKYKDSLRFLLLSYDEDIELYFDRSDGLLIVKEQVEKKSREEDNDDYELSFEKVLTNFKNTLDLFQENLPSSDMILSEANNDINKVRDILWQAIGVEDKYKAISCLKILLEKKSFDFMIKEDSRYKSILKRFIGIKFGQSMERSLDENIEKLIVLRLFLEMLLVEKLKFSADELYAAIYYLTNTGADSGQVMYLDKQDQKFKWCTIQVLANKFAWVDKI